MDRNTHDDKALHPYVTYYSPSQTARRKQLNRSPQQKRRRSWKSNSIYVCILLLVVGSAYIALRPDTKPVTAASRKNTPPKAAKALTPPVTTPVTDPTLTRMSQSIDTIIDQNDDVDASVNLIDLSNGQSEHYGTDDSFQAGSTSKIIAPVDWLHQVEIGQQTMSETVGPTTAANDIDQMITVSNDPDWKAIEAQLGYNNLQNYATSLGLIDYQAYNNSLPSGDMALILQKLWSGSLLNRSDTQLLLSYLKQANYRQYIVPAIPNDDLIYHKIGFYETYLNDAAIVTHGNQAFVIVIFTNSDDDAYPWPARATMMQDITKAALLYYFNQASSD